MKDKNLELLTPSYYEQQQIWFMKNERTDVLLKHFVTFCWHKLYISVWLILLDCFMGTVPA